MNNIEQYRKRFYNLMESTMGDVRPIISEQNKIPLEITGVIGNVQMISNDKKKVTTITPSGPFGQKILNDSLKLGNNSAVLFKKPNGKFTYVMKPGEHTYDKLIQLAGNKECVSPNCLNEPVIKTTEKPPIQPKEKSWLEKFGDGVEDGMYNLHRFMVNW